MRARVWTIASGMAWAFVSVVAVAADAQERGLASVEVVTGHAGYVDDAWDHRVMAGGVVRLAVTPRFTIGPEVVYLRGRHGSHEVTVTGTATYDLLRSGARPRVVPFVVFGGGLIRQSSLVGGGPGTTGLFPYSTSEATVSGGLGARIAVWRGLFVAPDVRLGWEPETRLTVTVGWRR
jgi:hypothetical protein